MNREAAEKALAERMHLAFNAMVPVAPSGNLLSTEELAACWYAAARIACDAIERAVIAERIEWTGDKYGGFEPPGPDQPYELPIPWSAVLDAEPKEGEP